MMETTRIETSPTGKRLVTNRRSRLVVETDSDRFSVDLYSAEGLAALSELWLKAAAEHKVMYEPSWMGIPVIQLATDMVAMQELLWRVRPDVVIECGVAHGGSLVMYASMMELVGKGKAIGIDVEIRKYNRVAIENHPMARRIDLIEADSTSPELVDKLKARLRGTRTVLVVLDSNHSTQHVLREMDAYHTLVTPGSYLVVMDGSQAHVWDIPRGKPEWKNDNPLAAIRQWLPRHPDFRVDPHFTRMAITASPEGFLRRLGPEELGAP